MLCKNDRHFDTNSSTTDKRLVTTGGDYEARGSVAQAFFGGNFRIFFCFHAIAYIDMLNGIIPGQAFKIS